MWKLYALVAVMCVVVLWSFGHYRYNAGWNDGRVDLLASQQKQATAERNAKDERQQANEGKAAAAETEGAAKTIVITNEVVRYVKSPDHTRCVFDDARLSIKQRAVANANQISGYDGAAVQDGGTVGGQ